MKIGELAKRTGLTVRTLHYYDQIGLLSPTQHTDAGYRLYAESEILRLQQIIALKQLGFSLEEIQNCLSNDGYLPIQVVELQLVRLREQIMAREELCRRLEVVAASLRSAETISVEEILEIMEGMSMMDKYYTPEQLAEIKQRGEKLGEQGLREAEAAWATLMDQVREEMAKGTDPASEAVQGLARQWMELIQAFTGGNPEIEKSLGHMYEQENTIHGMDVAEMREMGEYIGRAMAAGKDAV